MPSTNEASTPVLPLRDVVVYPHMAIPLFVGREKSVKALTAAMQDGKRILLVAQKHADTDEPGVDDLYDTGTLASILQLLKLPDGTVKVLVEGVSRAKRLKSVENDQFLEAEVSVLAKTMPSVSEVLVRHVRDQNADLLVMGAYGHSRLREAILGGATRAVLDRTTIADAIGTDLPIRLREMVA